MSSVLRTFAACVAFWILLSGKTAPQDFLMAAAASAAVALVNRDIDALGEVLRWSPRLLAYVPWLLKEIWLANLQVLRIVVHPRLPIDPVVIRLTPALSSDLARTAFANSITLTPGTITLDVEGGEIVVHALTRAGADDLAGGGMARRVGRIFREPGA
ncbi:MAG: Na+/H+ antiporter subunit E [Candidatus Rokuibacteriota bacterium]